jgi:hypothetical protein
VGDDDHRAVPAAERLVKTATRSEIEVVGRLVEQQHRGGAQQLGRQAQQDRLATGQLPDLPVELHPGQSKRVQGRPGPLVDVPVVADRGEMLFAGSPASIARSAARTSVIPTACSTVTSPARATSCGT